MYSTQNEGNSVLAERFIKTLKNKMYKHMTDVSKNVYIDKLDDIVNEYNNTYHRAIKMKPIEVKDNTYFDYIKEVNDKDPKPKVGDHVRILKYKQKLLQDIIQIGLKKFFVIKEVKNTVQWTYIINDFKGEEIIGTFYVKEVQK